MSQNQRRPLDDLQKSIGKNIIVRIRGNHIIRGILKGYDVHLNLALDNAILVENEEDSKEDAVGNIILRGDNVLMISPQ